MNHKYSFRSRRPLYIYLRCRMNIEDDDEASDAADAMFSESKWGIVSSNDDAELMAPTGDYYTLTDGFIVRMKTEKPLPELASGWKDHLSKFACWAIHDGKADVVEGGNESLGQVRSALGKTGRKGLPVTQVFLLQRAVDDVGAKDAASAIRDVWQVASQPAFHFRNGRVFFVPPPVAAEALIERMRAKLPQRGRGAFQEIAFDDGDGKGGFLYFGEGRPWTEYSFKRSED